MEEAQRLAEQFVNEIAICCEKVKIVGSVRRRKPEVKDIDLVLLVKPEHWWDFTLKLRQLSKIIIDGKQVKRVVYKGEQIDLYFATPETWGTLVLIRTGSAEHNIKLSMIAQKKGLKLSHSGLSRNGQVIATVEKEIFEALDLPYVEPEERE
ncbi:MAG: hypothetical protein OEZ48_09350 [Candidatus Bathyarchaeota archaeon]|nr:hypothetical protein [Candidatus Bathyarchaeota archaeon]